jgi:hypothetical protein
MRLDKIGQKTYVVGADAHQPAPAKPQESSPMKSFKTLGDAMGRPTIALGTSNCRYAIVLSRDTPKTVAVPAGAGIVLFAADGDFWCRFGDAAAVPAGDILDGNASELNPICRSVSGVSTIGLAANANRIVNLIFYAGGLS